MTVTGGFRVALVAVVAALGISSTAFGESNVKKRKVGDKEHPSERAEQASLFNYYFRNQPLKYETKLSELEKKATVPSWRVPYSTEIHPESQGGLSSGGGPRRGGLFGRNRSVGGGRGTSALATYDSAFGTEANDFEKRRIMGTDRALFPRLRMQRNSENWEGYCSGFTASTIRHPEPIRSVDASEVGGRRGVVFQPSDIKALLCGIYNRTTNDSYLYLAPPSARDGGPNMGTFHLTLGNYVGKAKHPVGIDRTKGRVSWNNPIYGYEVKSIKDAGKRGEITLKDIVTTITYTYYGSDRSRQSNSDGDRVGHARQSLTIRYQLELNADGEIVGGKARTGAGHFLWTPLFAPQATRDGTVPGNPHLDVRKILALARASAHKKVQSKYDLANIGPKIDPALEGNESDESNDSDDTDTDTASN